MLFDQFGITIRHKKENTMPNTVILYKRAYARLSGSSFALFLLFVYIGFILSVRIICAITIIIVS